MTRDYETALRCFDGPQGPQAQGPCLEVFK